LTRRFLAGEAVTVPNAYNPSLLWQTGQTAK
jgi:hypothetical protein